MTQTRTLRNYVRRYSPVTNSLLLLTQYTDTEMEQFNVADMQTLHEEMRRDSKFCAYNTFQISIITDENGLEHRSAPINESNMVKFGEVKRAEDVQLPLYTGMGVHTQPYSDKYPGTKGLLMVICGNSIHRLAPGDIVYDRASGKRLWPVARPHAPKGPQP